MKNSPIKEGKLYHKDLNEIWPKYEPNMQEWLLKLTEEFDLTYRLPHLQLNIVPCMLPDRELTSSDWTDISDRMEHGVKEFRVIYSFVFLPAGLFNRVQVRLFEYADDKSSSIWKNGLLLRKNNHKGLIAADIETDKIEVRVQGAKPENVVFLIHEVIETLIYESFGGNSQIITVLMTKHDFDFFLMLIQRYQI